MRQVLAAVLIQSGTAAYPVCFPELNTGRGFEGERFSEQVKQRQKYLVDQLNSAPQSEKHDAWDAYTEGMISLLMMSYRTFGYSTACDDMQDGDEKRLVGFSSTTAEGLPDNPRHTLTFENGKVVHLTIGSNSILKAEPFAVKNPGISQDILIHFRKKDDICFTSFIDQFRVDPQSEPINQRFKSFVVNKQLAVGRQAQEKNVSELKKIVNERFRCMALNHAGPNSLNAIAGIIKLAQPEALAVFPNGNVRSGEKSYREQVLEALGSDEPVKNGRMRDVKVYERPLLGNNDTFAIFQKEHRCHAQETVHIILNTAKDYGGQSRGILSAVNYQYTGAGQSGQTRQYKYGGYNTGAGQSGQTRQYKYGSYNTGGYSRWA